MQEKHCGICYDIYLQSQYKGNHKRGGAAEGRVASFVVAAQGRHLCILVLTKANIVATTTILLLHVGNGRSEHVGLDIMLLAINVRILCICGCRSEIE